MQISIRSFLYISPGFLGAQIDAFPIQFVPVGSFARRMWHNYRRPDLSTLSICSTCEYIVFGKSIKVWHVLQIGRKHSLRLAVRSGIVRLTGRGRRAAPENSLRSLCRAQGASWIRSWILKAARNSRNSIKYRVDIALADYFSSICLYERVYL